MYFIYIVLGFLFAKIEKKQKITFLPDEIMDSVARIADDKGTQILDRSYLNVLLIRHSTEQKRFVAKTALNFYKMITNEQNCVGTEYGTKHIIGMKTILNFLQLKYTRKQQSKYTKYFIEKDLLFINNDNLVLADDSMITFNSDGSNAQYENVIFLLSDMTSSEYDYLFLFRICKEMLKNKKSQDGMSYTIISLNIHEHDVQKKYKIDEIKNFIEQFNCTDIAIEHYGSHNNGGLDYAGLHKNEKINCAKNRYCREYKLDNNAKQSHVLSPYFACTSKRYKTNRTYNEEKNDDNQNIYATLIDIHTIFNYLRLLIICETLENIDGTNYYGISVILNINNVDKNCFNVCLYEQKPLWIRKKKKKTYLLYDPCNYTIYLMGFLHALLSQGFDDLSFVNNINEYVLNKNSYITHIYKNICYEYVIVVKTYAEMREKILKYKITTKYDVKMYVYNKINNVTQSTNTNLITNIKYTTNVPDNVLANNLLSNTLLKVKHGSYNGTEKSCIFIESYIDYSEICIRINKAKDMNDIYEKYITKNIQYRRIYMISTQCITFAELILLCDTNQDIFYERIMMAVCFGICNNNYKCSISNEFIINGHAFDLVNHVGKSSDREAALTEMISYFVERIQHNKKLLKDFFLICDKYKKFIVEQHKAIQKYLLTSNEVHSWLVLTYKDTGYTTKQCFLETKYFSI